MSTAFDAFWNAVETNKELRESLKSKSSPEVIVEIAAEYGFIFSKNDLDDDVMLNNGYRLVWPGYPGEVIRRVKITDFSNVNKEDKKDKEDKD